MIDSEYWSRYYEVTVDRPAWATVRFAIERFAADATEGQPERFAVDLGCGAGRDARELLRAGWRVLAIDREPAGLEALVAATPDELRGHLETRVADLAEVEIPPCDLVNASLSLPFLAPDPFWARGVASSRPCGSGGGSRPCCSAIGTRAPATPT
jgi:tellurite methyltransferase